MYLIPNAADDSVVCLAVFTYGDRGLQVTAAFLIFAVTMHLAEVTRLREAKGNGRKRPSTVGSTTPPQAS